MVGSGAMWGWGAGAGEGGGGIGEERGEGAGSLMWWRGGARVRACRRGKRGDGAEGGGGECETIRKAAGGVLGDRGFRESEDITTSARMPGGRELEMREYEYKNQISFFRAPGERGGAPRNTWRILFTDYRRPRETFVFSFRAASGLHLF